MLDIEKKTESIQARVTLSEKVAIDAAAGNNQSEYIRAAVLQAVQSTKRLDDPMTEDLSLAIRRFSECDEKRNTLIIKLIEKIDEVVEKSSKESNKLLLLLDEINNRLSTVENDMRETKAIITNWDARNNELQRELNAVEKNHKEKVSRMTKKGEWNPVWYIVVLLILALVGGLILKGFNPF